MAVAIDKSSLGISYSAASSNSIQFTTSQAVASGGFIVVVGGWFGDNSLTVSGVSGGSLSWSVDKQPNGGSLPYSVFIASAQAPSGLASSTTITASLSGSTGSALFIGGLSFTGIATSSPVDGTPTGPTEATTTAAWSTPSYAIAAGSVIVAACLGEGTSANNAPTSPSLEGPENDQAGDTIALVAEYRIETSAGSYTVAGTWSAGVSTRNVAVAYKAAAGGGGGSGLTIVGRTVLDYGGF
jgi:hypothetical protein